VFEGDRAGCESMKIRMALAILLLLDPGQLQPAPQKKNKLKSNNYIVPFRTEAYPCSVLSDTSQHRIEFRCSDVQSANSMRLMIAIMFLRK
jgi:hypothetical protein